MVISDLSIEFFLLLNFYHFEQVFCCLFHSSGEKVDVFFGFCNWDSLHAKAKQPLQGMELQEKEAQKD